MTHRVAAPIAARPRPAAARRRWAWSNPVVRGRVWQLLAVAVVVVVAAWLAHNTRANMNARGIRSGWDFLTQAAGFDIGEHLIDYESTDSYLRAFAVGLLNTLRVSLAGIAGATVLGLALGVARGARHPLLRAGSAAYVETFRNVPLLVQLLLWYFAWVQALPEAVEPWTLPGGLLLSKVGLALPWLARDAAGAWHWSRPEAAGFSFEGGLVLSPEFMALWIGLTLYTSAFIAEVVRAGLQAVPTGQREAADSIGLSRSQALRLVVLPQALRVIIPPLTNQYLNLTKNSSLAVAIGYPDVVSIANTALNQTGRALECIAVLMAVYLTLSLSTSALMQALDRRAALRER